MSTPSFHDTIVMITEDQSLFEASNFDSRHENLITTGATLCSKLKELEDAGQDCVDSLSHEQRKTVVECILEYQELLLPPKVCGACPLMCQKQAHRNGPEYEKRLLIVHAKMVESIFIISVALISYEIEQTNAGGKQYTNYAIRMNALANTLEGIVVKTNDHAKDELKEVVEAVDDFVKDFFNKEMKDSVADATKRIRKTRDILNPDSAKNITKRSLVSAQASLQEIMNSAAAVSAAKSKEKMEGLDRLGGQLKETYETAVSSYRDMEEPMGALKLEVLLERHKETVDILERSTDETIKLLKKQWKTVRGQSTYRPVAVYEMDAEDLKPQAVVAAAGAGLGAAGAGIGAAAVGAGNLVGSVAGKVGGGVVDAAKAAAYVPKKMGQGVVNVAEKGALAVGNVAVKGASAVGSVVNSAAQLPGKGLSAADRHASKMLNK